MWPAPLHCAAWLPAHLPPRALRWRLRFCTRPSRQPAPPAQPLPCREGHCWELSLDRLFAGQDAAAAATAAGGGAAKGGGKGKGGGALSLKGWTLEMLQAACVLAGCDFLPSLKGISFKTAAGFVGRRRNLAGALKAIRLERRFQSLATQEYCAAAAQALLAFQHALGECGGHR